MTEEEKTEEELPAPPPTLSLSDPDGDGIPGISWSASAIIIVVVIALSGLLFADKLPTEVLVLLLGGIGEHVRGRVAVIRKARSSGE